MKASEFVKKFGWGYSKHILYEDSVFLVDLDYEHLKRLVESHNLVERIGGLCEAKKRLEQADKEFSLLISFRNKYNELCSVYDHVLKQAIADVESCQ